MNCLTEVDKIIIYNVHVHVGTIKMNDVAKFVFRRFVCQHVLKTFWPSESVEDVLHVHICCIIVLTPDLYFKVVL